MMLARKKIISMEELQKLRELAEKEEKNRRIIFFLEMM